jgi:hypothetical protein
MVLSPNPINLVNRKNRGNRGSKPEVIPYFSASSLPPRLGAGPVLNEVKEQGWGLIYSNLTKTLIFVVSLRPI